MSTILYKVKELFEKIKPIFMSEETNTNDTPKANTEVINETANNATDATTEIDASQLNTSVKTTPLNIISATINGAGVGLLLGALLGLAVSPVVSGIIGTLSGLLAVLLGINEKYITPLKSIRIGAFGFFCVIGILMGIYIRTNNGLLPSREKMMEDYTKVGFTQQQARDFIAYREFNLVPLSWKGSSSAKNSSDNGEPAETTDAATSSETDDNTTSSKANVQNIASLPGKKENANKASSKKEAASAYVLSANETGAERKNVLYSSEIDVGQCYILEMTNPQRDISQIKNTFEQAGGTWKELADNLGAGIPESSYIKVLFDLRDIFCAEGKGGSVTIKKNTKVDKINKSQSLDEIKNTLSGAGKIWDTIVAKISGNIPEEDQKSVFISLSKILGHD